VSARAAHRLLLVLVALAALLICPSPAAAAKAPSKTAAAKKKAAKTTCKTVKRKARKVRVCTKKAPAKKRQAAVVHQAVAPTAPAPPAAPAPVAPPVATLAQATAPAAPPLASLPPAEEPTVVADPAPPAEEEPAAPNMLWGIWTDKHRTGEQPPWDFAAVDQVEAATGKGMSLLHWGTPMTDAAGTNPFAFAGSLMTKIRDRGTIPFFSWSTHAMRNYDHPDFTLAAIAEGRQDALITTWAKAAKTWGKPFFLRFNWEMNGGWFPWGERYGANQPGEYVAAWRHVHDIFTSVGAANATWVWCPTADPYRTLQPLTGLYPGDAYVDWTCIDTYNGNVPWSSPTQVMGSTYDEIVALAPDKPMVLGEVGSTEQGGSKAAWIQGFFAALPDRFPQVRGVLWFDKLETGPGNHTDWALDSSAAAQQAFATGVGAENYVGDEYATYARPGAIAAP
jgi:mannan endo-1,4-beta-mannosidase